MVVPDHRLRSRVIDAIFTRPLLVGAQKRFVLTENEEAAIRPLIRVGLPIDRLANGTSGASLAPKRTNQQLSFSLWLGFIRGSESWTSAAPPSS